MKSIAYHEQATILMLFDDHRLLSKLMIQARSPIRSMNLVQVFSLHTSCMKKETTEVLVVITC